MKTSIITVIGLIILFLCGCSQVSSDEQLFNRPTEQDLLIKPGVTPITADEAANVALLFARRSGLTTNALDKELKMSKL